MTPLKYLHLNLTLDTPEKTWQVAGAIIALIAFNIFYFGMALPPSSIGIPVLFWGAYVVWAMLGCIMLLRNEVSQQLKTSRAFLVFFILLIVTFLISALDHLLLLIALAFPGYYGGISFAGILILTYRAVTGKKPMTRDFLFPA